MEMDVLPAHTAKAAPRTLVVAVVFTLFTAVAFGFGLYLFALVVTAMRVQLHFHDAAIGIVTGAAQLAYLGAALACPRLARRFGAGAVSAGGVAAAALLLLALSGVQNVVQVGAAMAGLGACAACMMVPTVGVIARCVPFAYRSRVNGLVSSGTAYGQLANGLLVPWLLPAFGWRAVWIATGAASLALAALGVLALRRFAPAAFSRDAAPAAGTTPAAPARLLTARHLTVWLLLALAGMSCGPWQNYLSSYLVQGHGASLATVGGLWSTIGAVGLASGLLAGLLADRIGIRIALMLSYASLAGAALLIAVHAAPWQPTAAAVCFGLSFYSIYGLIPAYVSKTAEAGAATPVFAIANVFLGIGTTLGNVTGGMMPGWTGSLHGVYVMATALATAAALLTLCLPDERRLRA